MFIKPRHIFKGQMERNEVKWMFFHTYYSMYDIEVNIYNKKI